MGAFYSGVSYEKDTARKMKDMVNAANLQDCEKVASFFTDDCVYEDLPTSNICHDKKEFIDLAKGVYTDFPDHTWEIVSSFSGGNKIASEGIWSGTFTHNRSPERRATVNSL